MLFSVLGRLDLVRGAFERSLGIQGVLRVLRDKFNEGLE